jgi:hypothetical protein
MNERITLLAKQAGDYVNEVYTGPVRSKTPGKIWEDGHIGWHTQFNEKFAELIVRECIGVLSLTKDGTMKMNLNGAMLKLVEGIGKAYSTGIKEHFGVKE